MRSKDESHPMPNERPGNATHKANHRLIRGEHLHEGRIRPGRGERHQDLLRLNSLVGVSHKGAVALSPIVSERVACLSPDLRSGCESNLDASYFIVAEFGTLTARLDRWLHRSEGDEMLMPRLTISDQPRVRTFEREDC